MKKVGAKLFVNSITMIRLIGTFLMPFICAKMNPKEIIFYLIILLLTDSVDGIMARRLKVSTLFGALLDALADKLFGISTLALLAFNYPIMLLPIVTEAVITLINTGGATKGSSIESSNLGKLKTWILGIAIVIAFLTVYASDFIELINDQSKVGIWFIEHIFRPMIVHPVGIINSLAFICVGADIIVAYDYKARVKTDVLAAKENGLDAEKIKLKKGKDLIYALFDEEYYLKTLNEPVLQRLGEYKEEENERKSQKK